MNKDDNELRIKVLERSFDYLGQLIIKCYVENDEKATRENINKMIKEFEAECTNEIDAEAIKESLRRANNLTFVELGEMYDILQ